MTIKNTKEDIKKQHRKHYERIQEDGTKDNTGHYIWQHKRQCKIIRHKSLRYQKQKL